MLPAAQDTQERDQLDWKGSLGWDLWEIVKQTKRMAMWEMCSTFTICEQEFYLKL